MALNLPGLTSELQGLFAGPSLDPADLAQQWVDAFDVFTAGLVPASASRAAALAELRSALIPVLSTPQADMTSFIGALTSFSVTLGAGMAPAFVATPPLALNLAAVLGVLRTSHSEAASAWAGVFDSWMRTGLAVPAGGGGAIPWS